MSGASNSVATPPGTPVQAAVPPVLSVANLLHGKSFLAYAMLILPVLSVIGAQPAPVNSQGWATLAVQAALSLAAIFRPSLAAVK